MRIAVLGAGVMGGLYGAYLSEKNEVTLIGIIPEYAEKVNSRGLEVRTQTGVKTFWPTALSSPYTGSAVDLVLVFVKAMDTEVALTANKALIGDDTYILTLQNGSGHEDTLSKFVDKDKVLIGTTLHNADAPELGVLNHKIGGATYFGQAFGGNADLTFIADAFNSCGMEAYHSADVQKMVWNKLFINASSSALTGALGIPIGEVYTNPHAWAICQRLIKEMTQVAAAMGMSFDYDQKVEEIKGLCESNPTGLTSIYFDVKNGRRSEVDTISGSVVRTGQKHGVPTPNHCCVVDFIKAKELIK